MIALKEQIEQSAQEDYMDGYEDGVADGLQASGIKEGDAFFEIGLTLFAFICGCFAGSVWVQL